MSIMCNRMSERYRSSRRRGTAAITATFQAVLNKQLGKIMDAIDTMHPLFAYSCCKTLVVALSPKDRDKLLKAWIKPLDAEIKKVTSQRGLDLTTQRHGQKKSARDVLSENIYDLFQDIMEVLHKGRYLVIQPIGPIKQKPGRIRTD